ncbi:diguanylate cyclase [Rhodocyclus tenuis]|uniref:diguanylate cyclase n=2 Tax=Rhodocyclus TaxID=1064 RepID=A0A6L5JVW8_RHOTE|nr:diguanylate cyclase [Rhodocyclus gracilis]MQY50328.1 diguanylate cyclase [Rhodocyclus gracilis]MRD71776.1 diguanylate cyclase [Rhodocyclus gracilis]NJA87831.1 diguanylate cyclase [Rhodocyclus gracilis]
MKTLVIEDSASSRRILCGHLERLGFSVFAAADGHEGVAHFRAQRPDLVLLGLKLGDVDGFTVIRRIRQIEAPGEWTPIVFLTEAGDDAALQRGVAAGADDFLTRPVSDVALGVKVRAMQRILQIRQSMLVITRQLDTANQELNRLASLDGLTGVANRRLFDITLEREWRRAMRQGTALSVLMVDIDLFKQFNDRFGHPAGDECIRRVAGALATVLDRGGDLLARYGGEEFAVVLAETTLDGACFVAERMREAIVTLALERSDVPLGRVSASFGVACAVPMPETAASVLLAAADRALYRAKRDGRNCVRATDSLDPENALQETSA